MADLAVALQALERGHRLGQGMGAAPVQQVEVEPVGAEPPQAALAGGDGALGRRIVRIDLADQEDLVAPAADRLADHLLGTALGVHLGRVDQASGRGRARAAGPRTSAARLARLLAHAPGALAEHRDLLAAGERQRAHRPFRHALGSGVVRR